LKYITHSIWDVVSKCLRILDSTDTSTYLRKIDACSLLRLIAIKLESVADLIFGHMHRAVIKALETAQCDRVLKVRQAAIQAKQAWMKVGSISKGVEEGKTKVELDGLTPDELIKARTGYGDIGDVRRSI